MKLKLLYFDIETAPYVASIWHPKQRYVAPEQMQIDTMMLGWAAKWADDDEMMSAIVTPKEVLKHNDRRVVKGLARLVREADAIVAHNLKRFDLPRLNARVALYKDAPLGPTYPIDTLIIAKKDLGLPYYKLDYLAQHFGIGQKIDTDMELWNRCMRGEQAALDEMRAYNEHDVRLLEGVFNYMLPYAQSVPRLYLADHEDEWKCAYCPATGRENFQMRGRKVNQATTFQQYVCKNCGKYGRVRTMERNTKSKLVPL